MLKSTAGTLTAATAVGDPKCEAVVKAALTNDRRLRPGIRDDLNAMTKFQHCYWFTNAQKAVQTCSPMRVLNDLGFPMEYAPGITMSMPSMKDDLAYLKMIMMIMVSKIMVTGGMVPDMAAYPALSILTLARR